MKYKGIELVKERDREDELLCHVEFKNPDEEQYIIEEMEERLYEIFDDFQDANVDFETVTDELILVRCWDEITFDHEGVELLKKIYDKLMDSKLDADITIGVHVDREWFKREDGSDYNEDEVTYDEFLENLEF